MKLKYLLEKNEKQSDYHAKSNLHEHIRTPKNHFANQKSLIFNQNGYTIQMLGCTQSKFEILKKQVTGAVQKLNEQRITARKLCVKFDELSLLININAKNGEITIEDNWFESSHMPILKIKNTNESILKGKTINQFKFLEGKHAKERFKERDLLQFDSEDLLELAKKFTEKVNYASDNSEFSLLFNEGLCYFKSKGLAFGFALNRSSKQIFITTFMPINGNEFKEDNIYFEV